MKKFYISLAAVAVVGSAWAQKEAAQTSQELLDAGYVDVTPSYYKFYNGTTALDVMLRTDIESPAQPNLGNASFITSNFDDSNSDALFNSINLAQGNVIFGGAYWKTQDVLAKGFSLYDFGAPIGEVLILNGYQSNLAEALKNSLNLQTAPEIEKMELAFTGNQQIFWVLDYLTMNGQFVEDSEAQQVKVRVRFEINAFNNDMSSTAEAFNGLVKNDEQGNSTGTAQPVTFNEFANENGEWDPYQWMVYEVELPYNRLASYLRLTIMGNTADLNNGALLVRGLEIYEIPNSVDTGMQNAKYYRNWNIYTPEDGPSSAIDKINDNNSEVEFYNLQGVKISDPHNGIFIRKQGNETTKVLVK